MKKIVFPTLILLFLTDFAIAQYSNSRYPESNAREARRFANNQGEDEEEKETPDWKTKLFSGGSISVGFGNSYTMLGAIPHFGYSLTNFMDVAVSLNYNYVSQRDYYYLGDKLRQTIIGPGAYLRLFPLKFLFVQGQYEHSFIRQKYIPELNSGNFPAITHFESNSLLVGGGYAGGREKDNNSYYYFSILWDVGGNLNSPYLDGLGRTLPIMRAGINIALFQGKTSR